MQNEWKPAWHDGVRAAWGKLVRGRLAFGRCRKYMPRPNERPVCRPFLLPYTALPQEWKGTAVGGSKEKSCPFGQLFSKRE